MAYVFVIKEPTLIVIISGAFVANRLLSVCRAETKFCGHRF